MSSPTLNEQAERLAHTLTDWNYHPVIGVLEVDDAETLDDIARAIKAEFPKTEPFEEEFYICTKQEMFKVLKQCLEYDETPTRDVTVHDIPKTVVQQEREAFLRRLEEYVTNDSEISDSDIESGLPINYIFWKFAFVVVNKDGKSLFLYGGAYD